jgi:hypothetical protein
MVIDLETMSATYIGEFSAGSGKNIQNFWVKRPVSNSINTQVLGPSGSSYTIMATADTPGSQFSGSILHFEGLRGINSPQIVKSAGVKETANLPKIFSSPAYIITEDGSEDYFTEKNGTYTFNSKATLDFNNSGKSFAQAVVSLEEAYKAKKYTQWNSSNLEYIAIPDPPFNVVVSTLAGLGHATDGTGAGASFFSPFGVAVDGNGNVYVADQWTSKIRKISPVGVVTTLAGSGFPGFKDGKGAEANFNNPRGIAVDQSGTVYVADTFNRRIRKISSTGIVRACPESACSCSA